jgi:hypothetical protein
MNFLQDIELARDNFQLLMLKIVFVVVLFIAYKLVRQKKYKQAVSIVGLVALLYLLVVMRTKFDKKYSYMASSNLLRSL